jgi:hypothetical protein
MMSLRNELGVVPEEDQRVSIVSSWRSSRW